MKVYNNSGICGRVLRSETDISYKEQSLQGSERVNGSEVAKTILSTILLSSSVMRSWTTLSIWPNEPYDPLWLDYIPKKTRKPAKHLVESFFFVLLLQKQIEKGKTIMQSTANIENISISIPITDLSFLRTLSKKMGWTIKRQRKSGIDRALDDIKAGRVYEAKSVDDLFDQLEKWNTGSNTPAHSKSHINYVSVEATIWLNWRRPSQFLNAKVSCLPDTDLISFPADMQENGSVT